TASLVGRLKIALPDSKIILAIDSFFQCLPKIFPLSPDEILPLNVTPLSGTEPGETHLGALRALRSRLLEYAPDTVILAAHKLLWPDKFVAAASGAALVVAAPARSKVNAGGLEFVLREMQLQEAAISFADLNGAVKENDRYRILAEFVTG